MIYLDNAATTRPFDSVIACMDRFYTREYFNPSALYAPAMAVASAVKDARAFLCNALGGGGKLYFTSCATEANTWVYHSGVKNKKGNIVVSMGEHASGYENAQNLLSKGYDVRFVRLLQDGRMDANDFLHKIDAQTTLVSVLHCSNETGAVNDLAWIANALRSVAPSALFHSDGVQAFGKMPTDCRALGVDLYSISAHKIGGPKGIGALWVRDGIRLQPLLWGGGQENGARSGTENVAGIAGFAQAYASFRPTDTEKISALRQNMKTVLLSLPHVVVNEAPENSPFILSFSVPKIKAEILQRLLGEKGIYIGLGSACAARHRKNRVLSAMGRTMADIEGSARISFGTQNLQDDMEFAQTEIARIIRQMQDMQ